MTNIENTNTRLLYSTLEGPVNPFIHIENVDNYLRECASFELASTDLVIYSEPGEALRFGREVIGFDTEVRYSESLSSADYRLRNRKLIGEFKVTHTSEIQELVQKYLVSDSKIRIVVLGTENLQVRIEIFFDV